MSSDNSEGTSRFSRRSPLSPLIQKVNRQPRRKYRRWNMLEENALIKGVEKFGTGNWKFILDHFCDTFDERTEVDLKDKWRNMTKNKNLQRKVGKDKNDNLQRKVGEDKNDNLQRKEGEDKLGIQAIVNEDASGDVLSMGVQNQQMDVLNSKPWYLELRESRKIENLAELLPCFKEKEKKIKGLMSLKEKIDSAYKKAREDEYNLRSTIDALKMGLKSGEDSIKEETDKVLYELNTNLRAKLVDDMNYLREQIGSVQKQIATLSKSRKALESRISGLEELISSWALKVQELERMLEEIRVMGLTGEHVRDHIEKLIPDYQEIIFEMELKYLEIGSWEEFLCQESNTLDEVSGKLTLAMEKLNGFLCPRESLDLCDLKENRICLSEIFAKQSHEVCKLVNEAKLLSLDGADC